MTNDLQLAHGWLGSETVSVSDCAITLDRTWSPYVQGTATLGGIYDVDPDQLVRFRVRMEQWFATGKTAAEIAAELAPSTASSIRTGAWAGRTAGAIADSYQTRLNPEPYDPTFFSADLLVRGVELDLAERVTRLTLASEDARLYDAALVATSPISFAAGSIRAIVESVLSLLGVALAPGDADGELEEPPILSPGQTYRAFLTPLLQIGKLRLYADELRVWRLVDVDAELPGGIQLSTSRDVFGARPTIDRESGGYDSVVIEYRWTTAEGETFTTWDVAGPPRPRKTLTISYPDTPYPGAGAAANVLSRMERRRRMVPVEAASNYDARPTMEGRLTSSALAQLAGKIARVTFAHPARTMSVDLFDLESLSPTAVRAIPPGIETDELVGSTKNLNPGGM